MAEQTTPAASSPAESADPFNGGEPTVTEYNSYRETGEVPERFKSAVTADPAPADTPKEAVVTEGDEPESVPESDPEDAQEQPHKGAEKRIKQLLARTKELERKLADAAKTDVKTEPSTAQPPAPPQNYAEYRKTFNPSKFIEEYAKANPEATYEDANAAMADHMLDARDHFSKIEQRVQEQVQAFTQKVNEAKSRYADFDDVIEPAAGAIMGAKGMPEDVIQRLRRSPVMADLVYTLGSDAGALDKFIKTAISDKFEALDQITLLERGIKDELAKPKTARAEDGKFKAPEKQSTQAPKPPSPVGGSSSRAFDVNDESLDNDTWMRKRNAQLGIK